MLLSFLMSLSLLSTLSSSPSPSCVKITCLPEGIESTDVVSAQPAQPGTRGKVVTVTVAQKLRELKARCRKGKLVDRNGTEIRFYRLVGCWGNPPEDYQEQLEHQAKELAMLRKQYRLIEIKCNPSGELIVKVRPF